MRKICILGLILAGVFLIYRYTATPTIGWVDSGVITAAASQLGIANPPGFPTYMLLAHPWTWIKFVPLVVTLQLFSNLTAIANLILVGLLTRRVLSNSKHKNLAAIASMIALAGSYTFWLQANHAETMHLTLFFVLSIILLTSKLSDILSTKSKSVWAYFILIALCIGLGVGTNPIIISLLPAGLWWLARNRNELSSYKKEIIITIIISVLLGIGVYLYLPIRAMSHPFSNWGDPKTIERFFIHLRGAGLNIYEPETGSINGFTGQPKVFLESFLHYLQMFSWQFTPLLLPVIAWGWIEMRKKRLVIFHLLNFTILGNLICVVLYYGGNQESWMLTSWACIAVFLGVGLISVIEFCQQHFLSTKKQYIAIGLLLLTFIPLFFWFPLVNHRGQDFANFFEEDLYNNLPDNSVLIGGGDYFHSITNYAYAKGRKDIVPITYNMFFIFPWYRENLKQNTNLKISPEMEALTRPVSIEGVSKALEQLVVDNPDRKFFVTPLLLRDSIVAGSKEGVYKPINYQLKPHGLVFEVIPKEVPLTIDESLYNFKALPLLIQKPPFYLERNFKNAVQNFRTEYANAYEQVGRILTESDPEKAKNYYLKMQQVGPTNTGSITQLLAIFLATTSQWQEASYWFDEALARSPNDSIIKQNIATFQNEWAKSASGSASLKTQELKLKNGASLTLPNEWIVVKDTKDLSVMEKVELRLEIRRTTTQLTPPEFLEKNQVSLGTKVNEGSAQIPQSDFAYLRIFKEGNIQIWQFLLFKGENVFDLRLRTPNDTKVKEIDSILIGIK